MHQKISYDPPPVTEWQDLSAPVGPAVQPSPLEDLGTMLGAIGFSIHKSLEEAYAPAWGALRAGATAWVEEIQKAFTGIADAAKALEDVAKDLEPPKDRDRRIVPKHGSQGPRSGSTFHRSGRRNF